MSEANLELEMDVDGPPIEHNHLYVPLQKVLARHIFTQVAMREMKWSGGGGGSGIFEKWFWPTYPSCGDYNFDIV